MDTELHIASLHQLEQMDRCVELQVQVWNMSEADIVPRRVFILAQRIGGQVLGAFDRDIIIGFAMALPGLRNGRPYLHSHMLAVLPEYRNAGIGRRLKLAQREDALARGFELMEWTFDPLEIKNAYLNVHRLGAIVRRYHSNCYGSSSSPLQGGLPTDRLYAEWWMRSPHVIDRLAGKETSVASCMVRIEVPRIVSEWKQSAQLCMLASDIQVSNRIAFQTAFARGLAVLDYVRDADDNGSFLLGMWPPASNVTGSLAREGPSHTAEFFEIQDTRHD